MQCFLDLFISIYCSTCFRRFLLWKTSDKRHSENIGLQLLGKRTCTKTKKKKKKKEEIWPYSKTLCVIKFFEFRFQNGKSHTFLSDNGTCVRIYFSFWNISLNYNQQVATFSRFLYFYIYCSTFFRWFLLWETSDKRHSENIWLQLLGKRTCTKKKLTIFQNIMRNNIFLISFSKRKVTHISFTRWNLRLDFFLFLKYISKL